MAKKKKTAAKKDAEPTPVEETGGVSFPIQVNVVRHLDDGNVELEVNYPDEFRDWFMKEQGLKKWSEKRFQKVVGPLLQEYYDNLAKQKSQEGPAGPETTTQ